MIIDDNGNRLFFASFGRRIQLAIRRFQLDISDQVAMQKKAAAKFAEPTGVSPIKGPLGVGQSRLSDEFSSKTDGGAEVTASRNDEIIQQESPAADSKATAKMRVQYIYDQLFDAYRSLTSPYDEIFDDESLLEGSVVLDDTVESVAYLSGKVSINPKLAESLTDDEIAFALAHEIGHHLFYNRPLASGPVYYRTLYLQLSLDSHFAMLLGQEISMEKNQPRAFLYFRVCSRRYCSPNFIRKRFLV